MRIYLTAITSLALLFGGCTSGGEPSLTDTSVINPDSAGADTGTSPVEDTSSAADTTTAGNDATAAADTTPRATDVTTPAGELDNCKNLAFLDLTDAPGAGPAYPAPTLGATCGDEFITVTGNGIPPYTFVPMTPNALKAQNHNIEIPRFPKIAHAPGE